MDVSTILNGYFSDASRMFPIGEITPRAEKLVRVTRECVELGLAAAKPWGHLGDIAWAINSHAQANGYSVVEDIGGHGIGLEFHEEPFVSYVTPKGSEMVLVPGMMFTIEPHDQRGGVRTFSSTRRTAGLSTPSTTACPPQVEYHGACHRDRRGGPDKIKKAKQKGLCRCIVLFC